MSIREQVQRAIAGKILFTSHALDQMIKPDRLITEEDVKRVVVKGEIIEDYPNDPRGPSCLMLGEGEGSRVLHVVCAPKEDYLAIITAYPPNPEEWEEGFRKRRR